MQKLGNIVLYSTDDCRRLFKMCNKKILELFHQPDFPSVRLGRSFWVEEGQLLDYLGKHRDLQLNKKDDIELVPLNRQ